jgi:hypothetical protein
MTTESFIKNLWYNPDLKEWITHYDPDTMKCLSWRTSPDGFHVKYAMQQTTRWDKEYSYDGTIKNGVLEFTSPITGEVKVLPLPDCKKKELLLKWCIK